MPTPATIGATIAANTPPTIFASKLLGLLGPESVAISSVSPGLRHDRSRVRLDPSHRDHRNISIRFVESRSIVIHHSSDSTRSCLRYDALSDHLRIPARSRG